MCLGVLVFLFYSTNKWKTESGNWMQNQALWEWELIRHRWNFILTQRVPGSPWTESPCSTSTVWQSVLHTCPTAAHDQANCTTLRQTGCVATQKTCSMVDKIMQTQRSWTRFALVNQKYGKRKARATKQIKLSNFKCAANTHQKIN